MEDALRYTHGRKQLQWGYGYYGYSTSNRRWIYWAVPLIAVGVFVFIVACIMFMVRRRRFARMQTHYQNPMPAAPPQQPPVTGYPDYNSQYNNEYSSYNSMPQGPRPGPDYNPQQPYNSTGYKPSQVEMGYPQRY